MDSSTVLDRLNEFISSKDLSLALSKLLRVPLAWEALHDLAILEAVCKLLPSKTLSPGLIAAVSLGLEELPPADASLDDDVESDLEVIWNSAFSGQSPPENLYQAALLSIAIDRESHRAGAIADICQWALEYPIVWRPALACHWPAAPLDSEYLHSWLSEGSRGFSLAAWVLLANFGTIETAKLLIDEGSRSPGRLMQLALEVGEAKLAASLAQQAELGIHQPDSQSVESMLNQAMGQIARGAGNSAQSFLGSAWEMTSKLAGDVADWIAVTAEQNGEPIVAAEAWNQALQIQPDPNRRARLALCYNELGRTEEALELLASEPASPEEHTAQGIIKAASSRQSAIDSLIDAAQSIQKNHPPQPFWLLKLVDCLRRLGEVKTALAQSDLLKHWHPPTEELSVLIGDLHLTAGEPDRAIDAARIAQTLAEEYSPASVLLARSYDQAGEHKAAMEIWQDLYRTSPEFRFDFASSALKANQPEQALQVALGLLEEEPASLEPKTIVGNAMIQLGQHDEALQYLEESVASAPHSPQSWLALADCQAALDDCESELETIRAGLEAIPDSADLHFRMAEILLAKGQTQQARQYIDQALAYGEPCAKYFALHAHILERLEFPQEALHSLEEAFSIEPTDWTNRAALARAYYDQGQAIQAVKLLDELPRAADPDAHSLAARVFSTFALTEDDAYCDKALRRIDAAHQLGEVDPWFSLQQAKILERTDKPGQAFFAYRHYVNLAQERNDDLLESILGVARTALQTDQAVAAIATLEQGQQSFPDSTEILEMLAPAYIQAGMSQRALTVARHAVEISPDNPVLLRILSDAAAYNQNWDEAIESLERIASAETRSPETWLAIANVSISADRIDTARQSIARALDRTTRTHPDLLQRAASLVERLDMRPFAKQLLQRAFGLQTENLELACRLAELSEQLGDLETAQKAWLHAADLQPEELGHLDKAAAALWMLGRRSSAIGLWQRSLSMEPKNAPLHRKLAHALLENGEVQQALKHFELALELLPENLDLLIETGKVVSQYGSTDEAIEIFDRAKSIKPDSVEASLGLARCRMLMNEPDLAKGILESILAASDEDHLQSQVNAMLALAALQMGDLPVAARSFQNAKDISQSGSEEDIWLSRAALRMGRWDDALEILDRDNSQPSAERVKEQLLCRLRIEDARWLYERLGNAHQHAPVTVETHNLGQITQLLHWLESNISFAPWLEEARTWYGIHQQELDVDALIGRLLDGQTKPEVVQALAIRLIRDDKIRSALDLLDQCAMQFDTDLWGVLLRGICQYKEGKPSLARETLQAVTKNPVVSPMAYYFISHCWQNEGDLEEAKTALNTAISAWPEEPVWHFELAQLYLDCRRSDAALPHFQRAAEIDPKNHEFTLAYARCLRDAGHTRDAQSAFAHLIKLDDSNTDVLKEAGLVALANGDSEHAQHWLSEVAAKRPDDAHSLIGAARAAQRLGEKSRAYELSRSAFRLAPDDPEVLTGMAEIEASRGKLEQALDYFDRALEVCQDQTEIFIARSKLLLANKRPQEAIDALERAAEINPEDDRALSLLAEAYENLGKFDQAMTVASRAYTIAPLRPVHRLQLGRISRKAGQLDRAVDELSRAEQDHPTDPAFPVELGKAYEARAENKRALDAYRRAISLNPTLAEPHYRAGVLLKSQKAFKQACQMFERASELEPNNADILHQLAAVRALSLVHGGITKSVVST